MAYIPLSEIHETFAVPNGGELLVYGEIMINLQVGRRSYPQALVVADLGGHGAILVLDLIGRHMAVGGTLSLTRTSVQLHQEKGRHMCNMVSLSETLTIPHRSMEIVEVEVGQEALASQDEDPNAGVMDVLASIVELTGLMEVGSVVSVKKGEVPVNLLIVHDDIKDLKEDETVGRLVPVAAVTWSISEVSLDDPSGESQKVANWWNHPRTFMMCISRGVCNHNWSKSCLLKSLASGNKQVFINLILTYWTGQAGSRACWVKAFE